MQCEVIEKQCYTIHLIPEGAAVEMIKGKTFGVMAEVVSHNDCLWLVSVANLGG